MSKENPLRLSIILPLMVVNTIIIGSIVKSQPKPTSKLMIYCDEGFIRSSKVSKVEQITEFDSVVYLRDGSNFRCSNYYTEVLPAATFIINVRRD